MTDNTVINSGIGGDTIRDIDRGTGSKTQVLQLDAGGDNSQAEALVSQNKPLPVNDVIGNNTTSDNPVFTTITGDPNGNFAGVNLLETVMDDSSGLGLNVKILNQPKLDINGAVITSDAPFPIQLGPAPINSGLIIDTQGYETLSITSETMAGTLSCSNDLSNWQTLWGLPHTVGTLVSSIIAGSGNTFPCLARYIKITVLSSGTAIAYLRAQPFAAVYGTPIVQGVDYTSTQTPHPLLTDTNGILSVSGPIQSRSVRSNYIPPTPVGMWLEPGSSFGTDQQDPVDALNLIVQLLVSIDRRLQELPMRLKGTADIDEFTTMRDDINSILN